MSQRKHSFFFVLIAVIAAFSGVLFGYDTGVISGAMLFLTKQFELNAQASGMVVSAVLLGALLGAIFSGRLTDYFGRKRLLIFDALVFIVGTLITGLAPNLPWLIIGRIIVGLAIGVASYIAPMYIAEISPPKHRGVMVALNQLAVTVGITISYTADYALAPHGAWRTMFLVGIIPAAILFIGMLFLPDSPRWLTSKGKEERALRTLRRIRGRNGQAERELKAIKESLTQQHGNWKTLFSPIIRPTLVIGIGLAIIQQVTGVNTILYYAPTILEMAGFNSDTGAIMASIGVGIVFVLFTIIGMPLIDLWGRRPLLFLGLIGMFISLLGLSWVFRSHQSHDTSIRWVALISMLVYIACFAFSLGPIMWLMISEIYPLKVRGLGSSVATCFNWGSNLVVSFTFLSLVEYAGASATFLIYAIISALSLFFIWGLVPETKGTTLEEIEDNLYHRLPSRHLGKHSFHR